MRVMWVITYNTFKEIIRDRILLGIAIFAVLLFGLSIALGELSFAENARITIDLGLAGIHFSCVILALFIGSHLVWKEIEKQTILTVLTKRISRVQFLIGKFFGMALVLAVVELGLSAVLIVLLYQVGMSPELVFFQASAGIFLESLIILGFTLLFGVISKPLLAMMMVGGIFLIGHWQSSMAYFAKKSNSLWFVGFEKVLKVIVPDLERFNWRDLVVYRETVSLGDFSFALAHAGLWLIILISLSALLFERKDFV